MLLLSWRVGVPTMRLLLPCAIHPRRPCRRRGCWLAAEQPAKEAGLLLLRLVIWLVAARLLLV
jgi:hypothetical protein